MRLPLTELKGVVGQIDVFICCGSFEERSVSVAEAIAPRLAGTAIIVSNPTLGGSADESTRRLETLFDGQSVSVRLNSSDPLATADEIGAALGSVGSAAPIRYLVDISTFTHEALLILFKLIVLRRQPSDQVLFAYAGASEYAPGCPKEEKWLSQGVTTVRSVLGYSGQILPGRDTHLVILVGYEHERAAQLIQLFQPDRLSLGHGIAGSATSEKHESAMGYFAQLVRDSSATMGNVSEFEFSCSDPLDAMNHILAEVHASPGLNHIAAPMNTKLSTIGCALAAAKDESLQLCYAQARLYNVDDYSSPGDHCYLTDLDDLLDP